jgi:two-component system response regulator HydG
MKWTGNVREIRNFVDYLSVFSNSEEVTEDLIIEWEQRRKRREKSSQDYLTSFARNILDMDISDKIHAIECALIKEAIIISNNNKSAAAKLLGIHRKAVERRLTSITIL